MESFRIKDKKNIFEIFETFLGIKRFVLEILEKKRKTNFY